MSIPRTVYIVEDSPSDARLLQFFLSRSGYTQTKVFSSGLDGLNACLMDPPTALLLDLQLPQLRGEEVCRLLRATDRCRKLPILIVSELPDAHRKEMELLGIGANGYLKKPFTEQELSKALVKVLSITNTEEDGSGEATPSTPDLNEPPTTKMPTKQARRSGQSSFGVFVGYQLLEMLGAGGMGTVYKAVQLSLDRQVALKVLKDYHLQSDDMARRFDREARIMARINHPNIVQVYDFGHSDFHHYISMEFAPGGSVHGRAKAGGLTWPLLRRIVEQSAAALAYLHTRGIIHRDIKPSNILLSESDDVKIADFGITSASLPRDHVAGVVEDRAVMGTRYFLAPEASLSTSPTPATDQYALGMTLWQLLTGKAPKDDRQPVHVVNKTMPRELSEVVERAMARDPNARFPHIEEFAKAFLRTAPN